jgi:hypothetical protein
MLSPLAWPPPEPTDTRWMSNAAWSHTNTSLWRQLSDEPAGVRVAVALVEPVGPEIAVGLVALEHVVSADQHGVRDSDRGPHLPAGTRSARTAQTGSSLVRETELAASTNIKASHLCPQPSTHGCACWPRRGHGWRLHDRFRLLAVRHESIMTVANKPTCCMHRSLRLHAEHYRVNSAQKVHAQLAVS